MGYRSSIGVLFTLPDKIKSKKVADDLLKVYPDLYDDFTLTCIKEDHEYLYLRTKNDLKWYDSYIEVSNFMEFLRDFDEKYKGGGVHFLRIGENYEDNEEIIYGDIEKCIQFQRSMYIN
jgi:hypothetical protein